MKILSIVGARPNFMKIAPFIRAIGNHKHENLQHLLVHTGQHYDDRMSRQFFEELQIPDADINLGIGSGSHAEQVGQTMIELEKVIRREKPDWVVVVGDVNTTDRLADLLLTPDHLSGDNLRREGTPEHRIRFVGNIMIDTLEANRERAGKLDIGQIIARNQHPEGTFAPGAMNLAGDEPFTVITLHRPSNVDQEKVIAPLSTLKKFKIQNSLFNIRYSN